MVTKDSIIVKYLEEKIPWLVEETKKDPFSKIIFTGSSLTPADLDAALGIIGYGFEDDEHNGWEGDTWMYYEGHPAYPPVTMFYRGYDFTLELYLTDCEE